MPVLACVPDPRPLGAPEWAVAALRAGTGLAEPAARAAATLGLRAAGMAVLGGLVAAALRAQAGGRRGAAALLAAPLLAAGLARVNLGYAPLRLQLAVACGAALAGVLAWLALQRRPLAAAVLLLAGGGLFVHGTATGIDDELDAATRAVARQLLERAGEVPDGDAGFARLLELAFGCAAVDAPGPDPVPANRAAILALAVILGEDRVAEVAGRHAGTRRRAEAAALRGRITLQGRRDWSQHFWVSAGLSLLADDERSLAVGLAKELMDATPGGSGFSFADLAADAAGNAFTLAATRDADAARALQQRLQAGARPADFVPELRDLPEGLTQDDLHARFGGLGGDGTRQVVDEIRRRLAACPGLH